MSMMLFTMFQKRFDNKGKSQTVVDFHHVIEVRQLSVLPVLSSIKFLLIHGH